MRRREFMILSGGVAVLPLAARAQQPVVPTIGFLGFGSPIGWDKYLTAFRDGLRSLGFVEGKNVAIEYRWANGNHGKLPALAVELVSLRVTAIVSSGGSPSALAAKSATSTIPIIFTGISDPVRLGLVASLNRPASNLTGAGVLTTELLPKRFELLSDLIPKAEIFGLLVNPDTGTGSDDANVTRASVEARGKSLISAKVIDESGIGPAFDSFIAQNCGALMVSADPLFNTHRETIIALAGQHRIPAMYGWPEFPREGGMASYGPDLTEQYRLSGIYVGRILKGEKPQDLPVVQPTKFSFVINLKTMKTLNIEVPANILALADEVIE
jgi:putative tryptophan/tyrosine transport system substrate-binding protein